MYLFFDIDGTLLSHTEGVSKSTIQAVKRAKENGHKVFICTGRSYSEVPKIIDKLEFDGVIAAAGGFVKVGDEIIFNKIMPDHLVDNIMYNMEKLDLPYVLEGVDDSYAGDLVRSNLAKDHEKLKLLHEESKYEHSAYSYRIPEMDSLENYLENRTDISKATVYSDNKEQLLELKKFIDKDFDLINYGTIAEVIAKGLNKWTGIQEVLKHDKVDERHTFAIGDSLNDYDMVHYANIGVAMGNASDVLKEVADYVTDSVENQGIEKALEHFNLI